jgi:MFS family permease
MPMTAVIAFAVFMLLTTLGLVAFWSIPVEMNARLAGSIASIMNFGGNFGGLFSPMVAGFVVSRTNDWSLPFYTASAGCLLGALVLAFLVPVRTIHFASPQEIIDQESLQRFAEQ